MTSSPINRTRRGQPPSWHAPFLAMLPAIRRHAARAFRNLPAHEHAEGVQATIAFAAVTYARLVQLNRSDVAYAQPLARFGVLQYRSGRRVGSRLNSRDVMSPACRRRGVVVGALEDASLELLVADRRATPADIAALRIDLAGWLSTLSARDRRLANCLAEGETTSDVARMFGVTAGRVSQIRRKLLEDWRRYSGEAPAAPVASGAAARSAAPLFFTSSSQERTSCP